jgi:hypothetical protein
MEINAKPDSLFRATVALTPLLCNACCLQELLQSRTPELTRQLLKLVRLLDGQTR